MQKYYDIVQQRSGQVVQGAQITVAVAATGNPATIYEDNESDEKSQPITSDSDGEFSFKAANGEYDVTTTNGADVEVRRIILHDPTDSASTFVADFAALRLLVPTDSAWYFVANRATNGDSGGGDFYGVSGASPSTYTDNDDTIIVPTGGDGSSAFLRDYDHFLDSRWSGVKADGATDNLTTLASAITSANGAEVILQKGTTVVSGTLATSGDVVVSGALTANTGFQKTILEFQQVGSAETVQWDFSGGDSQPILKDMQIQHAGGIPDDDTHGIGLNFGSASYSDLENLWVAFFDTGIKITANFFYGKGLNNVNCMNNYSAGLDFSGNLMNGTPIWGGLFSRTVNGSGMKLNGVGSHTVTYSTYREGNGGNGVNATEFFTITDIGDYNEDNDLEDIYLPNNFPHHTATWVGIGGYHDVLQGAGKSRIRATLTKLILIGKRFFNEAATAPVRIDDHRGSQPSVYIGCEYNGKYVTSAGASEDATAVIIDTKHPWTYYSSGAPADGNAHLGSWWWNKDAATKHILGYKCVIPGRLATPAITTTATTTLDSKIVTISVSNNSELVTGEYIKISGVTFATGDTYARIEQCNSNGTITLDKSTDQAVSSAAISYNAAELQTLPAGNDTKTDYNVSCATGVAVNVVQFALVSGEKATVTIDGCMASTAADDLCTSKLSKVVFSNTSGTITATAATDFGAVDAAGGSVLYTISGGSSGNNARIFVTQSTGSARVFGYHATVVISKATPVISF